VLDEPSLEGFLQLESGVIGPERNSGNHAATLRRVRSGCQGNGRRERDRAIARGSRHNVTR